MRVSALIIVAITGVAALTGCSSLPAPPPALPLAPSSAPSAASSATPEPELIQRRVVITATEIQLFGDEGTLTSTLTYFDATASVVAALTEQFHAAPVVTETPGRCCHTFPAVHYDWGGFKLSDDEKLMGKPTGPEFTIGATAAEIGTVAIETVDGVRVGDLASEVAASHPGTNGAGVSGDGVDHQWFILGKVNIEEDSEAHYLYVWVIELRPGDRISSISAPHHDMEA